MNERDVILRVSTIRQMTPELSSTPKYLSILAVAASGPQEILISEDAARELQVRLKELLPIGDSQ